MSLDNDEMIEPVLALSHVVTTDALRDACGRIAPLWPLERFVAVNPYLGLLDMPFPEAARRLAAVAGAQSVASVEYYRGLVDEGRITVADIDAVLVDHPQAGNSAPEVIESMGRPPVDQRDNPRRIPTVATVAEAMTATDWSRFVTERISSWAAAYFDTGQAVWKSADRSTRPYASWHQEASIDRTPEIMGLKGFRAVVRALPGDPVAAAHAIIEALGIPAVMLEQYLHALLMRVGGWAAHAARIVWDEGMAGTEDDTLVEFLVIGLAWEYALFSTLPHAGLPAAWGSAIGTATDAAGAETDDGLRLRLVLQDAFDHAEQRRLTEQFATARRVSANAEHRPEVQAVFCIDVRSEVFRRSLEATGQEVETLGFAGFFGMPIEFVPLAHERGEFQLPVLLSPGLTVEEGTADPCGVAPAVDGRRLAHQVRRAWKSFKMGAISCFSFVGPVGLAYLPKLVSDATGRTRPVSRPEVEGLPRRAWAGLGPDRSSMAEIPLATRADLAEGALRGMSLTSGFASVVLLAGHGSSSVNNPYATGLDCGACGGHTGEANARVAAAILNEPEVRDALQSRGITVPTDTWFVAGLHDTTTDHVALFDHELAPPSHARALAELTTQLATAGSQSRLERAARLGLDPTGNVDAAITRRSNDWAQVRPEWGLAGCRAFIAAPRRVSAGLDLKGRAFLHSYDRHLDHDGSVLTLIMTAPMVVASWISLQYYASTVDNELFGSGNKTLHNVVSRTGVLEGNSGDLRSGLPWQSVHDGTALQHEPLRLKVVIATTTDAINEVISANEMVRQLCDHGWLQLLAMDDEGAITHRYRRGLAWDAVQVAA